MAKRKSFEDYLVEFVEKYQEEEVIDEKLKSIILDKATSWNKESIMVELIRRIDEYRQYKEFSDEERFPYQLYLTKFMQGMPKTVVEEEDFST